MKKAYMQCLPLLTLEDHKKDNDVERKLRILEKRIHKILCEY